MYYIYKVIIKIFRTFHILFLIDDKTFLKMYYYVLLKQKLNFENPETFNEKLQWLKVYDRKEIYTTMVDKYEAKNYVANIIGKEYIIPTLGLYNKFKDIDFTKLPNQFVIKCTHDSGGTVIVKDKEKLNISDARKKINKCLKHNYFYNGREWPYKNVKPRIIIEKYMEDSSGDLLDYKIYSFNGKAEYIMTCVDRAKGKTKFLFYNRKWELQKNMTNDGLKYGDSIHVEKPNNLDKMFQFACKLSSKIKFVRVDFYEANGNLYFGEMTFYPSSGFDGNRRKETDEIFSNCLKI